MFNSASDEVHKKVVQSMDWEIEDGGFEWGSSNTGSGFDNPLPSGSTVNSSGAGETVSQTSKMMKASSKFSFDGLDDFRTDLGVEDESHEMIHHPPLIGGENLIGLKLGKRTYFEDAVAGGGGAVCNIVCRNPRHEIAVGLGKKTRSSSSQNVHAPRCQVEGCNLDLSSAKDYHRKHRVCESHTKSPKVIVGGIERRFCQQCSRFHGLSEFDEKKRSCRRRLSDHNARRRKPQPEAIQFNPGRILTSLYGTADGRGQLNLGMNGCGAGGGSFFHSRSTTAANLPWEDAYETGFLQTRGFLLRPGNEAGIDEQGQFHPAQLTVADAIALPCHDAARFLQPRGVSIEGFEGSPRCSAVDSTHDLRRAHSLLSTGAWNCRESGGASHGQPISVSQSSLPRTQAWLPEIPLAPSVLWRSDQHCSGDQTHLMNSGDGATAQFQEFQLLKPPYDPNFCSDYRMN